MKLVITTQYKENYGAHDWDGEGECPQYWKFKGGDTYFVSCTLEEAQDPAFWQRVESALTNSSDYSEEYILSSELVDDIDFVASNFHDEWESPYWVHELTPGRFHVNRTIKNNDMYDQCIVHKYESYFIGDDDSYKCEYLLTDGRSVSYSELAVLLQKESV